MSSKLKLERNKNYAKQKHKYSKPVASTLSCRATFIKVPRYRALRFAPQMITQILRIVAYCWNIVINAGCNSVPKH